jgi:N-acetylmuramoyl-L-alanine amidase
VKFTDAPSAHFNDRRDGKKPSIIVLHYTDLRSLAETLEVMRAREVSAHYVVDEDGTVCRVVDESKRAWHAGKSYWRGEADVNSASIGIEIQNPGHHYGYRPFTAPQIAAVSGLCAAIAKRHDIPPRNIIGHSDICPGRRDRPDPGHLFPWEELAKDGIGLWPSVTAEDRAAAKDLLPSEERTRALLEQYGYEPAVDFRMLQTAFQRHFSPEKFTHWEDHPVFDAEDAAKIIALMRQK